MKKFSVVILFYFLLCGCTSTQTASFLPVKFQGEWTLENQPNKIAVLKSGSFLTIWQDKKLFPFAPADRWVEENMEIFSTHMIDNNTVDAIGLHKVHFTEDGTTSGGKLALFRFSLQGDSEEKIRIFYHRCYYAPDKNFMISGTPWRQTLKKACGLTPENWNSLPAVYIEDFSKSRSK